MRSCSSCSARASRSGPAAAPTPRGTCAPASRSRGAASRTTSCSAASVTWPSCASAEGRVAGRRGPRPRGDRSRRGARLARPSPSRRPRCSRSAGLSTCGAIPRRSRRLARAADAARASSDLPVRLQIAALSALAQLDSGDGARRALETLRGPLDEVGDWQPPGVLEQLRAQRRGAHAPRRGRARRGCRGRGARCRRARRAAPSRRGRRSRTPTRRAALALLEPHVADGSTTTDLATRIEVLVLHAVARHAQLDHEGAPPRSSARSSWPAPTASRRSSCRPARRSATCSRGRCGRARATAGSSRSCASCSTAAQPLRRSRGRHRCSSRSASASCTVLGYLETMLSTEEIAAELFLSTNTVKTHTKSIYRKLGVTRRRHAVSQARAHAADLTGMTTPEPLPPRDVPLLHEPRALRPRRPVAASRRACSSPRSRWRSRRGACSAGSSPSPASDSGWDDARSRASPGTTVTTTEVSTVTETRPETETETAHRTSATTTAESPVITPGG